MENKNKIKSGKRYLVRSMEQIFPLINKHKIISFDVFDTLLTRKTYLPTDVFSIVSVYVINLLQDPKFDHKRIRIESEKTLRNYCPNGEVSIDDIYTQYLLVSGLPNDIVEEIKKYEIEIEKRILQPRKSVQALYNYCKEINKKIIIISDFYMDSTFIKEVLKKNKYNINDVEFYISCEVNMTKKSGELYDKVLSEYDVHPTEILHIGDNFHADTTNAMKHGINVVHLPSPKVCLDISDALKSFLNYNNDYKLLNNRTLERSIIYGLICNRMFDDPFHVNKNVIFGNNYENFGYILLGPLLVGFVQWLYKHIKENDISCLLFLSRDGYILKKAFDLYIKHRKNDKQITTKYIYASRRMLDIISYSIDMDYIIRNTNIRFNQNTLRYYLDVKYNIKNNQIKDENLVRAGYKDLNDKVKLPEDKVRVLKLIQSIKNVIFNESTKMKELFVKYLESEGIYGYKNIAIIDIGYFGSMQKILQKILFEKDKVKSNKIKTIKGYYLAVRKEATCDPELCGRIFGYIANGFEEADPLTPSITKYLIYLEQLFSAPHPSVKSIYMKNGKIKFEYFKNTQEEKHWEILMKIHKGALDFVKDFCQMQKNIPIDIDISKENMHIYISKLLYEKNNELQELYNKFVFENFYNGEGVLPLMDKLTGQKIRTMTIKTESNLNKNDKNTRIIHRKKVEEYDYQTLYQCICRNYHKENYEIALDYAQKALKLNQNNAHLLRIIAEIYLKLNRKEEAIKCLEKAHEIIPDNKAIKRRLLCLKNPLYRFYYKVTRKDKPFPVPIA